MTVTHLISELLDAVGDATTPSPGFWGFKVFLLKKDIRWKSLDREKYLPKTCATVTSASQQWLSD